MHKLAIFCSVLGVLAVSSRSSWADDAALPGPGWTAGRYESLWTNSPFSVATPEAAAESTEYSLWGVARIDGISYASVTNKSNSEHFLLSTEKPVRGLTLVSIARGDNPKDTVAVVKKEDGESISLKLEEAPTVPGVPMAANAPPNPNGVPMPGNPNQQIPPGNMAMPARPGFPPGQQQVPPVVMRRPPIVHFPPNPQGQQPPIPQPVNR